MQHQTFKEQDLLTMCKDLISLLFPSPMNASCCQPNSQVWDDVWNNLSHQGVMAISKIPDLVMQLEARGVKGNGNVQQELSHILKLLTQEINKNASQVYLEKADVAELVGQVMEGGKMEISDEEEEEEDDDNDSLMEANVMAKCVSPQVTEIDAIEFNPKRKSPLGRDLDEIFANNSITDKKFKSYEQQISGLKVTSLQELRQLNILLNDNLTLSNRIKVIKHDLQVLNKELSQLKNGSSPSPETEKTKLKQVKELSKVLNHEIHKLKHVSEPKVLHDQINKLKHIFEPLNNEIRHASGSSQVLNNEKSVNDHNDITQLKHGSEPKLHKTFQTTHNTEETTDNVNIFLLLVVVLLAIISHVFSI